MSEGANAELNGIRGQAGFQQKSERMLLCGRSPAAPSAPAAPSRAGRRARGPCEIADHSFYSRCAAIAKEKRMAYEEKSE